MAASREGTYMAGEQEGERFFTINDVYLLNFEPCRLKKIGLQKINRNSQDLRLQKGSLEGGISSPHNEETDLRLHFCP